MPPAKPSLDLLRSLTDQNVLRAFLSERRLTRAELSVRTGLSKPTMSDSVRRLTEAGLVRDTGERTSGPGRIGTYYALADSAGSALVVSVAPDGVVAEQLTAHGDVAARVTRSVPRPARLHQVRRAVTAAARDVIPELAARSPRPVRLAVVSAADPVDRATGRLVHLPDAPFLVGDLSPVEALAGLVDGPVIVDNDVNWAARAERDQSHPPLDDFVYLHLGEGLGCAVVSDGEVRRGAGGLAGEIAHLLTTGARGRAVPFTEIFAGLGLRRAESTAIDSDLLVSRIDGESSGRTLQALASAIAGVVSAAIALTDPAAVVIGGEWGHHSRILEAVSRQAARLPRSAPLRPAAITHEPAITAARRHALDELHSAIAALA